MKYHRQLCLHDPANDSYGDCQRTAIACLLDKESPLDVPNYAELYWDDPDKFGSAFRGYLRTQGYDWVGLPYLGTGMSPKEFLCWAGNYCDQYYMVSGMGARGVGHVVIAKGKSFCHDPHPSDDYLVGPFDDGVYWIYLILAILPN